MGIDLILLGLSSVILILQWVTVTGLININSIVLLSNIYSMEWLLTIREVLTSWGILFGCFGLIMLLVAKLSSDYMPKVYKIIDKLGYLYILLMFFACI